MSFLRCEILVWKTSYVDRPSRTSSLRKEKWCTNLSSHALHHVCITFITNLRTLISFSPQIGRLLSNLKTHQLHNWMLIQSSNNKKAKNWPPLIRKNFLITYLFKTKRFFCAIYLIKFSRIIFQAFKSNEFSWEKSILNFSTRGPIIY